MNRRCAGVYCTGRSQQSGRGVDADRFNKVRQWTDAEESLGLGTTAGFGEEEGARGEGSSERESCWDEAELDPRFRRKERLRF